MAVNPIPEGFRTVSPHLMIKGASDAIAFYKKAFGAEEIMRMSGPDGKSVMHAELNIGDSRLMVCDEFPNCGSAAPSANHLTTVSIHLYVPDVDAVFNRAVQAGATPLMPPMDAFWGDRYGKLTDPFGHVWGIATHIEDVSPEECGRRAEAFAKQMGDQCQ
ncbi:MAG: VOC family protein [Phycisphaerales bacterium]|nr:VOC family protein [Phycisphaerales bacterium]